MVPRTADPGRQTLRTLLPALALFAGAAAQAGTLRACDPPDTLDAAQKDRLFRFGAAIKAELDQSGLRLALVARSGTDLSRFGQRYSHAGFSLQASPASPWAVRQLYYACDEKQPRIFDQGMLAFVLGMNSPAQGYVSALLLPEPDGAQIAQAALDPRVALQLLGATYSANAYAYSLQYQNCNQWVVEVLAAARGGLQGDAGAQPEPDNTLRARAQGWLLGQGYVPTVIDVGWRPLMWAPLFVPWLRNDDHPDEDQAAKRYRVSMPASIESFLQAQVPGATRLEFCHNEVHVVVRRGGEPLAEGCVPGEGDRVIPFD